MTRIALAVLEDARAQAERDIVARQHVHRLALAWLAEVGAAQDWQCRNFWGAMISNETGQAGDFARYCRVAQMDAMLRAWYRALGWREPTPTQRSQWEDDAMCNLYRMTRARAEIADLFRAADHWQTDMAKPYVAPGGTGPVVIERDGERTSGLMTWGVPNNGKPVTNVRNLASPFWRSMLNNPHQRCLVPVTDFQEWTATPDPATGKKRPHWFSVPSRPVFAFAGIWRKVGDNPHFAFLTTEPNALVAPIHPKAMPVILDEGDYGLWLTADWSDAAALVLPYPSQLMAVA